MVPITAYYYSANIQEADLPPKDSLRIKDKSPAPKVSCIWRFHCSIRVIRGDTYALLLRIYQEVCDNYASCVSLITEVAEYV